MILKASRFLTRDAEVSVDLTWDDLGGAFAACVNSGDDANDNAGVYVRFVDVDNFYFLDFNAGAAGSPDTTTLDLYSRNVVTEAGCDGTLTLWVAHQPLDINQDGRTSRTPPRSAWSLTVGGTHG